MLTLRPPYLATASTTASATATATATASTSTSTDGKSTIPFSHPRRLTISLSEPTYLKHAPKKNSFLNLTFPIPHHVRRTVLWILIAVVVALLIAAVRGPNPALEFVTGYIVEYSLSVDNLFVFLLIFRYFKVPPEAQQTVLTYGIFGAMALRAIMIIPGKALVEHFEWVALAFAALLIYSAGKLLFEDDDDDNLDNNRIIKFSKAVLPVTDSYVGNRFFVRTDSKLLATPLAVVLVAIELSDVLFAIDSVPAVLGISNDVLVIYTSNILAIMGLRSLFFVISTCIGNLRFLKHALSIVLAFIGVKMIAGCLNYDFGVGFSLFVVVFTLVAGVTLSLLFPAPVEPQTDTNDSKELTIVNSV